MSAPAAAQPVRVDCPDPSLSFTIAPPPEFLRAELPPECSPPADPGQFNPLAVFMTPYAACVLTISWRPAFAEGSLMEWAQQLAASQEFQLRAMMPTKLQDRQAVEMVGLQQSDAGLMHMRMIMLEDGGRLFMLGAIAPEQLWGSLEKAFDAAQRSFRLIDGRGCAAEIARGYPAAIAPSDTAGESARQQVGESAQPDQAAPPSVDPPTHPPTNSPDATASAGSDDVRWADYALDDSPASFDPEHPYNANFRDKGMGLVPNVASIDESTKTGKLAFGSIVAFVTIPFGWHPFDDGRRAMVLCPAWDTSLIISRVQATREQLFDVARHFYAEAQNENPTAEFVTTELPTKVGSLPAFILKGVDNGKPFQQAYVFRANRAGDAVLRLAINSTPEHFTGAANIAGKMFEEIEEPG
jgi:hypothetical protein